MSDNIFPTTPDELKEFKITYAVDLMKENYKQIVINEHRIVARQLSIKEFPDTPEGKLNMERMNAEIVRFTNDIKGLEKNIEILGKLIEQYRLPQHERN